MNFLRNSRSVFSRLQTIRRYSNPAQPQPAGSIRGLLFRHAKPVAAPQTLAQPKEAGFFFPWGLGVLLFFLTCDRKKVPCTNRAHWVFLPPPCHAMMEDILFDKIKNKRGHAILGPSDATTARVRLIASDIIRAAQDLFPFPKNTPLPGDDDHHDFKWEVIVVNNEKVKAYSLANGKILVYTGLLNRLNTDAEIAALIAHEAGHVIANHDMEFAWIIPFYGKFASQRNEMEANLIGLNLLEAAGFDTQAAHVAYEKFQEIGRGWWSGFHPWCKRE